MMHGFQIISVLILVAGSARVSAAAEDPVTCNTCHSVQAERLAQSVHARISCRECHGGDDTYALTAVDMEQYLPAAGATRQDFDHGSAFNGKPARPEIPDTCGECHANVERMNPYGLRTDQLARYWTSGHGKTLKSKGDTRVAVCVDCHGTHGILPAKNPDSRTHPFNVPGMCATCHADPSLMGEYGLPSEISEEYRRSVHGQLLFEQQDTGAPTCATCHGNHSALPPGFASVGAVCGQCHANAEKYFSVTAHADQTGHKACIYCHGGGDGRHSHLIERMTLPTGLMIARYRNLLASEPDPTPEQITDAINPGPRRIMTRALPTCTECHDELDEDESLPVLFDLLEAISEAERGYVETALRLEDAAHGVLLVEHQRFAFEDAKTHLIELAPLQHTLDPQQVTDMIGEFNQVCGSVNTQLDDLERGLRWRYWALIPIWAFAVAFAAVMYFKYKQLETAWVTPMPDR